MLPLDIMVSHFVFVDCLVFLRSLLQPVGTFVDRFSALCSEIFFQISGYFLKVFFDIVILTALFSSSLCGILQNSDKMCRFLTTFET